MNPLKLNGFNNIYTDYINIKADTPVKNARVLVFHKKKNFFTLKNV